MKEVLCIEDFTINDLTFLRGYNYRVAYNEIDGRLYISNIHGYTPIPKEELNRHFL